MTNYSAYLTSLLCFLLFSGLSVAETRVEKYTRLYGYASSTDISIPCQLDKHHTMESYLNDSIGKKIHENPYLFDDKQRINLQKIPRDMALIDEQGIYINNKPTDEYFLPEKSEDYRSLGIICPYGNCKWLIKTLCTVKNPAGIEMLVYRSRSGELTYVPKEDFEFLEQIK